MAYTPKIWRDDPTGGTPITAAELNRMETQYAEAVATAVPAAVSQAAAAVGTAVETKIGPVNDANLLKNVAQLNVAMGDRWSNS